MKHMTVEPDRVDTFSARDRPFLAPEVLQTGITSYASDIYALGRTLAALGTPGSVSFELESMIKRMINPDPDQRIKIQAICDETNSWGIAIDKYGLSWYVEASDWFDRAFM
jgi:serine/threonine protein kinase